MNEFEQLVLEMRRAQRDYFRCGGYEKCVKMQQLQFSVDRWLRRRRAEEMQEVEG